MFRCSTNQVFSKTLMISILIRHQWLVSLLTQRAKMVEYTTNGSTRPSIARWWKSKIVSKGWSFKVVMVTSRLSRNIKINGTNIRIKTIGAIRSIWRRRIRRKQIGSRSTKKWGETIFRRRSRINKGWKTTKTWMTARLGLSYPPDHKTCHQNQ